MLLRRAFAVSAAGVLTGFGVIRYPAGAAQFTYKLGHEDPPTMFVSVRLQEAVDRIKTDSGGRLEIQVFPNEQLGGSESMIAQLRLGAIQFLRTGCGILAPVVPPLGIDDLPYVFTSYKQAFSARDGVFGSYLRNAAVKAGMYAFATLWENGFKEVYNNVRPINTPDDLKGLKIRTSNSPTKIAFFKALGASPTPMSVAQIYTSLQTHILDGSEMAYTSIYSHKYYEVTKYLSATDHDTSDQILVANSYAWAALPKNLRDLCERHFNTSALASRDDLVKEDAAAEAMLKEKGMVVNRPDLEPFKTAVRKAGLYAQWRDLYGAAAWSALEKSVGKLV